MTEECQNSFDEEFSDHDIVKKIRNKNVKNETGISFVIQYVLFFKVTLQHNINMMCKIREYDACWSCVKMLNFCSKTFKMLEFSP